MFLEGLEGRQGGGAGDLAHRIPAARVGAPGGSAKGGSRAAPTPATPSGMPRRKKPRPAPDEDAVTAAPRKPVPDKLQRPFAAALVGVKVAPKARPAEKSAASAKAAPAKAAPSATPARPAGTTPRVAGPDTAVTYEDRVAFHQAYAGVTPLGRRPDQRLGAAPPSAAAVEARHGARDADQRADEVARRRLDALVGGAVRFDVQWEGPRVAGLRRGAHRSHLVTLGDDDVTPGDRLDLHGMRAEEAGRAVVRFVRDAQRRGERVVLIVHGRGLHSDGGAGVLAGRAVAALGEGGAAPCVLAFRTAPGRLGGEGALLVRLERG